jgi:hypothetical protein
VSAYPDWVREPREDGSVPTGLDGISLYLGVAHALIDYLLEHIEADATENFPAIFQEVERQLEDGDDQVQNWVVIGFFEDVQNIASYCRGECGSRIHYNDFELWLGPKSLVEWNALIEFWHGERPKPPLPHKARKAPTKKQSRKLSSHRK